MIAAALLAAAALQVGSGLDCTLAPDALLAQVRATPNLTAYSGADPLLDQWDTSGGDLYAATRPGHPAHPTVVKRVVQSGAKVSVDTSACGYGDKAGYDAVMHQIDTLNAALIARGG